VWKLTKACWLVNSVPADKISLHFQTLAPCDDTRSLTRFHSGKTLVRLWTLVYSFITATGKGTKQNTGNWASCEFCFVEKLQWQKQDTLYRKKLDQFSKQLGIGWFYPLYLIFVIEAARIYFWWGYRLNISVDLLNAYVCRGCSCCCLFLKRLQSIVKFVLSMGHVIKWLASRIHP